MIDSLQSILYK